MNPLKEYPNLFANGKFSFMDEHSYKWNLIGVIDESLIGYIEYEKDTQTYDPENATLIARPISDMSDEEKLTLFRKERSYKQEDWETCVKKWADDVCQYAPYGMQPDDPELDLLEDLRCSRGGLLYLTSIGVYPFDQNHFGDAVIDKTEAL